MSQRVSYLTTFESDHHWQNDTCLTLTTQEELMAGKEYQVILGHGLCSKKNVPLDWTAYQLKVVHNK